MKKCMLAKRIREKLIQLIHRFYLVKIDCFDMLCFFMVPGILPNWPSTKLGVLSMGQTYSQQDSGRRYTKKSK